MFEVKMKLLAKSMKPTIDLKNLIIIVIIFIYHQDLIKTKVMDVNPVKRVVVQIVQVQKPHPQINLVVIHSQVKIHMHQ